MLGQTGQPPRSALVLKECCLDVVGTEGALADLCGSPAGYPVLELLPRLGWGAWQGPGTMLQVALVLQLIGLEARHWGTPVWRALQLAELLGHYGGHEG